MSFLDINTQDQLTTFLTQQNKNLSNITININKIIDMKNININNTSFILDNVIFNGKNRSIKNLNLSNPLFTHVKSNSIIKYINLSKFNNVLILKNEGSVENCILDGIYATNKNINSFMVSENIGKIYDCAIVNCNIKNTQPNTISMGLICGTNIGTIDSCESKRNNLSNLKYVAGGLVGINKGIITKCYVENLINTSAYSGGLVGDIDNNSNINNCLIDTVILNNNGLVFARVLNNNFKVSCIKIKSNVFNKYIKNDIMNNHKDKIENIMVNNVYNDLFNINNSINCFSTMKNSIENFMNIDLSFLNIIIFLIILFLLISIIIYLKFYKK